MDRIDPNIDGVRKFSILRVVGTGGREIAMADSAQDYSDDDPVVVQYENWAYPAAVADLTDPAVADYLATFQTLRNLSPAYWPAGQPRPDLDILVAGCGTLAAACYAYLYPHCRVVGIDISRTSLAHEQRLKEHHRLANLTLHHCPVERVESLGIAFDYISSHGVLHHLPDPAAGLKALGSVLRTDGVIALMLYGKYGRAQVERLQELFRHLALNQTADDLAIVRDALAALPDDPQHQHLRRSPDLRSDAGMVDLLLHRRERSYTVADCLKLVGAAGLVFQRWDQNYFYHPDGPLAAAAPEVRKRLASLSDAELWQTMELAVGAISAHYFVVCRPDRDSRSYRVPWGSAALLDCVPLCAAKLARRPAASGGDEFAMVLQSFPPVPLTSAQAAVFSKIDGRRTVGQCLIESGVAIPEQSRLATADGYFKLLTRTGFGILRIPPRTS
jgi:SAM-dependent methyltransferase